MAAGLPLYLVHCRFPVRTNMMFMGSALRKWRCSLSCTCLTCGKTGDLHKSDERTRLTYAECCHLTPCLSPRQGRDGRILIMIAFGLWIRILPRAGIARFVQWLGGDWTAEESRFESQQGQDQHWRLTKPLFNGYRGLFPGVMRKGREANHLPPPSAEVKNDWSCLYSHLCLYGVRRDCTFLLHSLDIWTSV
jgi:hypothetical protein